MSYVWFFGSLAAFIAVVMVIFAVRKTIRGSSEKSESLEQLMELKDEIHSKIKYRLTTCNWWTRRKFITKYGRPVYEAYIQTP